MNVTWNNSLGKAVLLDLCGIETLKIIYTSYLGKVFESLTTKFKVFKDLKISDNSGFSF